jgi:hypothetical protein
VASLLKTIKEAIESYDPDNLDKLELYQHIARNLYAAGFSQAPAVEIVAETYEKAIRVIQDVPSSEAEAALQARFYHLRKSKDKPSKS